MPTSSKSAKFWQAYKHSLGRMVGGVQAASRKVHLLCVSVHACVRVCVCVCVCVCDVRDVKKNTKQENNKRCTYLNRASQCQHTQIILQKGFTRNYNLENVFHILSTKYLYTEHNYMERRDQGDNMKYSFVTLTHDKCVVN